MLVLGSQLDHEETRASNCYEHGRKVAQLHCHHDFVPDQSPKYYV